MRDVAVLGVGMNKKWGELWDTSLRDLFVEAALAAVDDAGVDHLDSMYVGCMTSGLFAGQEHLGCLMADYLATNPIPATRVESACASGGAAFRQGYIEVASGISDFVLVGGVEKMTDVSGDEATYALSAAADMEYEAYYGVTFPGLYALMARVHMDCYGTTSRQLAHVAVKNHKHGAMNPEAQYPFAITVEDVLASVMVADPLHILDCSPITDGAAAVVLCPLEPARKVSKKPVVQVLASAQASGTIALHSRQNLASIESTSQAAAQAYRMAGKGPQEIQVAEVHDCFTIAEIMAIEALGFVPRGKGGEAAESGMTAMGGRIPVNTSGGLKAKGHPVGATGVAQVVEITRQLRGEAGARQVQGAKIGLTQNMGGTGGSSVVHILGAA
ncbi:MAG TPA: thiolase domain-containing protein [Bryobacteraceae bacterium]|nr:thiolase domain-containing protein [Bryobacteraceae bacterium]